MSEGPTLEAGGLQKAPLLPERRPFRQLAPERLLPFEARGLAARVEASRDAQKRSHAENAKEHAAATGPPIEESRHRCFPPLTLQPLWRPQNNDATCIAGPPNPNNRRSNATGAKPETLDSPSSVAARPPSSSTCQVGVESRFLSGGARRKTPCLHIVAHGFATLGAWVRRRLANKGKKAKRYPGLRPRVRCSSRIPGMARLLADNVEGTRFKNTSVASHAQPPKSPARYNTAMAWQQARQEIRRKDGNLESAAGPPQQTRV